MLVVLFLSSSLYIDLFFCLNQINFLKKWPSDICDQLTALSNRFWWVHNTLLETSHSYNACLGQIDHNKWMIAIHFLLFCFLFLYFSCRLLSNWYVLHEYLVIKAMSLLFFKFYWLSPKIQYSCFKHFSNYSTDEITVLCIIQIH